MNIVILHRVPFDFIKYDGVLDHTAHQVTYVGLEKNLLTIPTGLPCVKVAVATEDDLVQATLAHVREQRIVVDRIVAMSSYHLQYAATLRTLLAVPGEQEADFALVNDKMAMKKAVLAAGLRAPKNIACVDALSGEHGPHFRPWPGKTVIKPCDGSASRDVVVYPSYAAALAAIADGSLPVSAFDPARFEIEEFIEGRVLHVDGYRLNGRSLVSIESRYVGTCLAYAQGEPLGSVQSDIGTDRAAIFDQYLDAVNLKTGAFHLEMIEGETGLCFLEVAARVGGADVATVMELSVKVKMDQLSLALMLDPRELASNAYAHLLTPQERTAVYGWFVFPGHFLTGNAIRIDDSAQLKQSSAVLEWREVTQAQEISKEITYNYFEVPLSGVVCHPSSAACESMIAAILAHTTICADA